MTCEHLRPLLDEVRSMHLFFRLGDIWPEPTCFLLWCTW